ncbi:MAG: hypothetical protein QOI89_751 [Solirubrobacteraceae bacterium]|nr:hypothetical protein [Solirubrobacteraceae bacterium]
MFRAVPSRAGGARSRAPLALMLASAGTLIAGGCGGGAKQTAHEPAGTFTMKIVRASFPAKQAVARPATLELQVRNTGSHTVPNVAISLDSLAYTEHFPELAANKRPVWVIEQGPGAVAKPPVETQEVSTGGGAQTAYVNTWALGPLAHGQTQTFRWQVVAVKPGAHTVNFRIAAGLAGKAKVALAHGAPLGGRFSVNVAPAPPTTHVDPNTGRVVAGAAPAIP